MALPAFDAARSFDSFNNLSAVFAFLLGRFFGFDIFLLVTISTRIAEMRLHSGRTYRQISRSIVRAGAPSPVAPSYLSGMQKIS